MMIRALRAVLSSGVKSTWIDESTGERVDMQKMARDALALAGVQLP